MRCLVSFCRSSDSRKVTKTVMITLFAHASLCILSGCCRCRSLVCCLSRTAFLHFCSVTLPHLYFAVLQLPTPPHPPPNPPTHHRSDFMPHSRSRSSSVALWAFIAGLARSDRRSFFTFHLPLASHAFRFHSGSIPFIDVYYHSTHCIRE
ncbi:uncharacterized protein LAESUDRAFT_118561 [Laetiporus sulphureus 93-53]|uniref:Uncharacterized protein n=1 Tax=Laetiporus sulphureus 93-53 TaxID=1314785 RepID=A0A165EJL0_9APHY|nr:uncharacterized protein LAESUDRAFT_118561 [Laetiporus sulphureus 93-53]KZT07186.1 hypothetical protein LAESUDRAFT_118561 [Laetiporus sulphureus 93-53]